MLANLARVLRCEVVLTTNFDTLIEQAFQDAGMQLKEFPVHLDSRLPAPRLINGERSIVKINGGPYGLRANFSLDEPPSEQDRHAFCGYLAGAEIPWQSWKDKKPLHHRFHLLVAGSSGGEVRTREFVDEALARFPELTVFWISYSSAEAIRREFATNRVQIIQHHNLGLLFLELYQRLTQRLPGTGVPFPALWHLPMPAQMARGRGRTFTRTVATLKKHAEDMESASAFVLQSPRNVYGVSSLASTLYFELDTRERCIWIDLDDIASAEELFIVLTSAIAARAGQNRMMPTSLTKDKGARCEELRSAIAGVPSKWFVFLNARDGPGTNAGANSTTKDWRVRDSNEFWQLLRQLTDGRIATVAFHRVAA